MQTRTALEPGQYYHIYSRGVNRTPIFFEERNYAYFLELCAKHVSSVAETLAYCLMGNHFHLLVRIRAERVDRIDLGGLGDLRGLATPPMVSRAFSNWLNAYAKAINKAHGRTGSLFQGRFGRSPITSEQYLVAVVRYIHYNPQKHGLVKDFRDWPYSSYHALLSEKPTRLARPAVLGWFGGPQAFRDVHAMPADESTVAAFVGDDEA